MSNFVERFFLNFFDTTRLGELQAEVDALSAENLALAAEDLKLTEQLEHANDTIRIRDQTIENLQRQLDERQPAAGVTIDPPNRR